MEVGASRKLLSFLIIDLVELQKTLFKSAETLG